MYYFTRRKMWWLNVGPILSINRIWNKNLDWKHVHFWAMEDCNAQTCYIVEWVTTQGEEKENECLTLRLSREYIYICYRAAHLTEIVHIYNWHCAPSLNYFASSWTRKIGGGIWHLYTHSFVPCVRYTEGLDLLKFLFWIHQHTMWRVKQFLCSGWK